MVTTKTKTIVIIILVAIFTLTASTMYYSYRNAENGPIIGNSMKEKIESFYDTNSINQRITTLALFSVFLLIIIAIFIIIRTIRAKKNVLKYKDFSEKGKSETDLDVLYEILKQKKEISIDDIAKTFKIDLDTSLGWSKTLENADLAIIDYQRFGKPILKLMEKINASEETPRIQNEKIIKNITKKKPKISKKPKKIYIKPNKPKKR